MGAGSCAAGVGASLPQGWTGSHWASGAGRREFLSHTAGMGLSSEKRFPGGPPALGGSLPSSRGLDVREAGVGWGCEVVITGLRLCQRNKARAGHPAAWESREQPGRSCGRRRSGPKTAILNFRGRPGAQAGSALAWQAWWWRLRASCRPTRAPARLSEPHRTERKQSAWEAVPVLGGDSTSIFFFLLKISRKRCEQKAP